MAWHWRTSLRMQIALHVLAKLLGSERPLAHAVTCVCFVSLRLAMVWICRTTDCRNKTFRRPPSNFCSSCRSCRRGRNHLAPTKRFNSKAPSNSLGQPAAKCAKLSSQQPGQQLELDDVPGCSVMPASHELPVRLGDADSDPIMKMCTTLETSRLRELKELCGSQAAHHAVATALGLCERYRSAGAKQLPACSYSLCSFALALSGVSDDDALRARWLLHLTERNVISRTTMQRNLCLWTMSLPPQRFC